MDKIITQPSASDEEILQLENEVLSFYRLGGTTKREHRKSLNVQEDKSEKINFYEDARTLLDKFLYMDAGYEDAREAYRLFLLGAQGCPKCLFGVGLCLYRGYGVKADGDLGLQISKDAMPAIEKMGNDNEALVIMFEYYEQGYGTGVHREKAMSYLSRANCPRAYFLMAECHATDTEPYLRKAIKAKFPPAYFAMGTLYRSGRYGSFSDKSKVDLGRAKSFFTSGADMGCQRCKNALSELSFADKGFTIENGVLIRCNARASEVHVPDIVISVAEGAFYGSKIGKLYLPSTVKELPKNVFDPKHIPTIVSANVKDKSYRTSVAMSNAGAGIEKSLGNAKSKLRGTFKRAPLLSRGVVLALVLTAIGSILNLTKLFPLNFPITVPLFAFVIGAVAMIVVTAIGRLRDGWSLGASIVASIPTLAFALLVFYGGIIPEKWLVIPFGLAILLPGCFIVGLTGSEAISSIINLPVTLSGIVIVIGGASLGLFNFNTPSVFMIIMYSIAFITGLVMMILGWVAKPDDEFMMILCSPMMIISTVGICLGGAFVWWVHLILLLTVFMQSGAMGSKVGEEFNF